MKMESMYEQLGVSAAVYEYGERIIAELRDRFDAIDQTAEYNQAKVLSAMQKNRVNATHFAATTGYGYDDEGRDNLERVYADVFHTEAALVRPQITCGTHALTVALSANLLPGDELLSPVGAPYDTLEEVISLLGTYDITTIRASMGMYLCCKAIRETTDIRVLLTGEISDELFGYKYTDFAPSPEAFQQEAKKRVDELYMYDVLRADRCISANSLEARVPFGDLDFVKYVMSIDPAMKVNTYDMGKYLLRHAFEKDHLLPDDILWRQKAAFSDAVGHSMVDDLKAYAETKYTDAEFEEKRKKYGFAQPFTKESLLYREIFEKYYPGQAPMVKDFWMPNKSWKGCDVNDPSARVLSNYGESGT